MPWKECEQKFIRKVTVDLVKVSSIKEMAFKRWEFIKSVTTTEKNVSFVFEGYYEVIKELLVALLLQSGFRSQNHQCLITFLSKEHGYDAEVNIIKQMNFLRNRLNYYGEAVELAYFQENYKSFEKIITLVRSLLKK